MRLVGRNVVVRGEFNRAIVTPKWLVGQEILEDGEVQAVLTDHPNAARLFTFGEFKWHVGPDRLMARGLDPEANDPGPIIARILDKLPHTPVTAIGHNFLFEVASDPSISPLLGARSGQEVARSLELDLTRSEATFVMRSDENSSVTVKATVEKSDSKLDLNFHFQVTTADEAKRSANASDEMRGRAVEIVRRIIEEQS